MNPRLLALTTIITGMFNAVLAADPPPAAFPIPPRTVRMDEPHGDFAAVMKRFNEQTGITVSIPPGMAKEKCPVVWADRTPFWLALGDVADRSGTRIVLHDDGRKVSLEPRGKSKEVSAVTGPFRTVARGVTARSNLEIGLTVYEVHLDAHWEPRFPVYRIDSQPTVTKAVDDRGIALTVPVVKAKSQPHGAQHAIPFRVEGLTRASRKITRLEGEYTVTAAAEMLPFKFDPSAKLPAAGELPPAVAARVKGQVTATLMKWAFDRDTKTWEARIELTYPADQPVFESFESWLGENKLRLTGPDGKVFAPDGYNVSTSGRRAVATYGFKEDATKGLANPEGKGWSLVYETPAPLVEFKVPFVLENIPLP
jgi:hypothetical protein